MHESRRLRRSLLLLTYLVSGAAVAGTTVYKCTKPDGSVVFTETSCGNNAKEVDTSSALRTGTSPNVQGVSDRAAMAEIDSDCAARDRNIRDASDRDLNVLQHDMRRSANNLAGATRDTGIRSQIDGVVSRRDADLNALAHECDQRRAAEQARQEDRDAATAKN